MLLFFLTLQPELNAAFSVFIMYMNLFSNDIDQLGACSLGTLKTCPARFKLIHLHSTDPC